MFSMIVSMISTGCGDDTPDTSAEAAEEINESGSGLVQISQGKGIRAVAKYLTPEYLAAAEVEKGEGTKGVTDSMTVLFSRTMSFHISASGSRREGIEMEGRGVRDSSAFSSGVMDVESVQSMFRLECDDRVWSPLCALPESRVGDADQTWFVVFPVDAGNELRERKKITLVFTPLDADGSGDVRRFTYNVEDLLRPEFIASNN